MPRPANLPRLTVDSVMKIAHDQALRHANLPLDQQIASPAMRQAIEQVWTLVKGRLGQSEEVARLDELIGRVVRPR